MTGSERGDGRNVDPALGILEGEGADQRVPDRRAGGEGSAPFEAWRTPPTEAPAAEEPTYFGRPVLKEPVWVWTVAAYFYVGGAAGAASVLGAVAQAADRRGLHGLVKRCRWIAALGAAAGTGFLVYDLGRPERFLNMLRVFRPTSPLSVGSWVLATATPISGAAALGAGASGSLGAVADAAGLAAGVTGLPMSGYTAVLLSNTAIPVWSEARRSLPALFVSSAVTAAASLLDLMRLSPGEERIVKRFGIAGKAAELAAMAAVERDVARVRGVDRPLREGVGGELIRVAKVATGAALALSLWPGKRRAVRTLSGILGTLGAMAFKFGIFSAGPPSARDPLATFRPQRQATL
jgi:hypothetical protein